MKLKKKVDKLCVEKIKSFGEDNAGAESKR